MKKRSAFGVNLRKLREAYGLDPAGLSKGLNLGKYGRQAISNWENGYREPSLYMLCQIADFFGVSTDVLLGREEGDDIVLSDQDNIIIDRIEQLSTEDKRKLLAFIEIFLSKN